MSINRYLSKQPITHIPLSFNVKHILKVENNQHSLGINTL